MRKSIDTQRSDLQRRLLATVSSFALLALVYGTEQASAANGDADRPPVWIELGWHFENASGIGNLFTPSFENSIQDAGFLSPSVAESRLGYSYGGEGKISFQPGDPGWIFSAAVRYGRAHSRVKVHEQHFLPPYQFYLGPQVETIVPLTPLIADTRASNSETHAILDFQVGKDVGLGLFGNGATSVLAVGLRFAQFHSTSNSSINVVPHITVNLVDGPFFHNIPFKYSYDYTATAFAERNFRGFGPAISWSNSVPVVGTSEEGELLVDWGVNAAVLFGRQKAVTHHQTKDSYFNEKYYLASGRIVRHYQSADHARKRNVVVPNAGGSIGVSYRLEDFKISVGYRGDFFFGAVDGGWDTRRSTTRAFYGPFASVSIGLGD